MFAEPVCVIWACAELANKTGSVLQLLFGGVKVFFNENCCI